MRGLHHMTYIVCLIAVLVFLGYVFEVFSRGHYDNNRSISNNTIAQIR